VAKSNPDITYTPRLDATPEAKISALANVYGYVLACRAKKEAAHPGSPDDGTEVKEDSAYDHYTGT
jgi:hypothetical protein